MPAIPLTPHPSGRAVAAADARSAVLATLIAAALFVVMIWTYSAIRVTSTCHSTQGHVKVGRALNGLVCVYHDGVTRVSGL